MISRRRADCGPRCRTAAPRTPMLDSCRVDEGAGAPRCRGSSTCCRGWRLPSRRCWSAPPSSHGRPRASSSSSACSTWACSSGRAATSSATRRRALVPAASRPRPSSEALFLLAQIGCGARRPPTGSLFTRRDHRRDAIGRGRRLALAHVPGVVLVAVARSTNAWHHGSSRTRSTVVTGRSRTARSASSALSALYVLLVATVRHVRPGGAARTRCRRRPSATRSRSPASAVPRRERRVDDAGPHRTRSCRTTRRSCCFRSSSAAHRAARAARGTARRACPPPRAQAFHGMADGGIVLTPEGASSRVNDAAERMLPQPAPRQRCSPTAARARGRRRAPRGRTHRPPHGEQAWWLRVVPMRLARAAGRSACWCC